MSACFLSKTEKAVSEKHVHTHTKKYEPLTQRRIVTGIFCYLESPHFGRMIRWKEILCFGWFVHVLKSCNLSLETLIVPNVGVVFGGVLVTVMLQANSSEVAYACQDHSRRGVFKTSSTVDRIKCIVENGSFYTRV